jgi:hypothetical protein
MFATRGRLFLAAFVIFGLSLVATFIIWPAIKRAQLRSCVYYTGGDIAEHSRKIAELGPAHGDWYVLSSIEKEAVLSELPQATCTIIESQTVYTNGMEIAVRRQMSGPSYEVRVWLRGPDNQSGTEDDVMAFPNETPLEVR